MIQTQEERAAFGKAMMREDARIVRDADRQIREGRPAAALVDFAAETSARYKRMIDHCVAVNALETPPRRKRRRAPTPV